MRTKFLISLLVIATISISFFACSKMGEDLKTSVVSLKLPDVPYDYSTSNNTGNVFFTGVDNNVATLGRVLFYDTRLSLNNSISCGSCHKQAIAFSDDVAFSAGFENHPTLRNTLPIQNLSNNGFITMGPNPGGFFSSPSLFWDGRANFLPSMVLMPVMNHVEMGMNDINAITDRVKNLDYYKNLFIAAYGNSEITTQKVADGLSAFVSSIVSNNTRFDRSRNGQTQLTALEEQGKNLFFNKYNCNSCHQTEQMNGYELGGGFVNIGLDQVYTDKGKQNVSNDPNDNGKFKIPNLRNVTLTAPYMHDGRFKTLDEVLNHYSQGIKNSSALDMRLRDINSGQPLRMNITTQEKGAIIAFLGSLTDYSMITDPKFSNPFKAQ